MNKYLHSNFCGHVSVKFIQTTSSKHLKLKLMHATQTAECSLLITRGELLAFLDFRNRNGEKPKT